MASKASQYCPRGTVPCVSRAPGSPDPASPVSFFRYSRNTVRERLTRVNPFFCNESLDVAHRSSEFGKCVLSPELQECMDQTKGALLRAHTAEEAAKGKTPKVLGSEPGAN